MHFNKGIFVVLILLAVILVSGCTQTYDVNRTGTELIKAKPSITITSKCLLDPQPCKNADSIQATFAVDDSELWNQTNTGILKIQIKDKPATPFTIDIGDSRIVGLTDNTGKATLTVCDELLVKGLYSDCAGNAKIPKSGQLTLTYKIYSSSDYLSSIFSKTEAVKIPDRPPLSTTSPRTVTQSPSTSPIIIVTASPTPTQKPVVVGDVFLMNMRIPEVFPDICNKEGTVATLEFIAPNQTGYTYTLKQLTFFEEGTVPKNATGPYKLYKNGELVSTTTIKPTSEIIFETFISPFTLTGGQKLDNITVKTSVVSASGDKVTKISLEGAKISATPPGGQTAEFSLKADKIVSSFAQRPEKIKKCPPDIVSASSPTPAANQTPNATTTPNATATPTASAGCNENWTCGSWSVPDSSCPASGIQRTRTCSDSKNCGTTDNKPATTEICVAPYHEKSAYLTQISKGIQQTVPGLGIEQSTTVNYQLSSGTEKVYAIDIPSSSVYEITILASGSLGISYQQRYSPPDFSYVDGPAGSGKTTVSGGPTMQAGDVQRVALTLGPVSSNLTGSIKVSRKS